jgi:hypothetical protein
MPLMQCPKCREALEVSEELLHRLLRCGLCGQAMRLPAASAIPVAANSAPVPAAPRTPWAPPPAVEDEPSDLPPADTPAPAGFPELGGVVRELRPRQWWIGLLSGSAVLALAILVIVLFVKRDPPRWVQMTTLILLVGSLIVTLLCGWKVIESVGRRVWLCEHGVLWKGLGGRTACLWADADAVTYQKSMGGGHMAVQMGLIGALVASIVTKYTLTIRKKDGQTVTLPATVTGLFHVWAALSKRLKPALLPGIYQAIDARTPVAFGPLVEVLPLGLKWVDGQIAWQDLTGVILTMRFDLGRGVLKAVGPRSAQDIEIGSIENLELLLDVLERRFGLKVDRQDAGLK